MKEVIARTKRQIDLKTGEIARLQAEVTLLNAKLKEQERMLAEYEEAKLQFEQKAQNLVDSNFFEPEEVIADVQSIKLEERHITPVIINPAPAILNPLVSTEPKTQTVAKADPLAVVTTQPITQLIEQIDQKQAKLKPSPQPQQTFAELIKEVETKTAELQKVDAQILACIEKQTQGVTKLKDEHRQQKTNVN